MHAKDAEFADRVYRYLAERLRERGPFPVREARGEELRIMWDVFVGPPDARLTKVEAIQAELIEGQERLRAQVVENGASPSTQREAFRLLERAFGRISSELEPTLFEQLFGEEPAEARSLIRVPPEPQAER